MKNPTNEFKRALSAGRTQIGLWVGLADGYAAELLATTGFDWLLIDGEHAPNDLRGTLAQLQSVAPYEAHPIVRPPEGSTVLIKQLLDIGAQTLLVPMVESAEQAAAVVAATRYPPRGIRGVGSALARSSRWNQIDNYLHAADEEICVLVQVETAAAMQNVDAIAAVAGVDGVFFGPADLSASMGLLGQPGHESVQAAITHGIHAARKAGKAAGVLCADPSLARRYLDLGATFVAVGVDTTLLAQAARKLCAQFKGTPADAAGASGAY
ncbi:MAG: 4-hydroxy-2-oxoheptanedioate aldolase [Variovorax paradoxus]|nr:MAG: 4-hydroxy-2-oxoheptanedioate aldolase [Variovorax paradoxus]PZQ01141.1 MAG: 4-hydroxy-2-oxoheptanedioate aldolase [Variovorax paradoxus]